jgi:hypothetical protein
MYRVRSSAIHSFCENRRSSQSICVVSSQEWQVTIAAS